MSRKILVGGVHEYTNIPFLRSLMRDEFFNARIELRWIPYPSGSAPMAKALTDGNLDMAILLTDSAVRSIATGANVRLVSPYVTSKLDWVFHTMVDYPLEWTKDISSKKFAISKFGSGGHLISLYWAKQAGITLTENNFLEVGDMDNAVNALKQGVAHIFPWERLTTSHYVESGLLREVHNILTPYPPFSFVASGNILHEDPDVVKKIVRIIQSSAAQLKYTSNATEIIASTYNRSLEEVEKAWKRLVWATTETFNPEDIDAVIEILLSTGAIQNRPEVYPMAF